MSYAKTDYRYGLKIFAEPAVEPVNINEAKIHCRISLMDVSQDALIDVYIKAARTEAEAYLSRRLINSTWDMTLDCFPDGEICIPYPPLQSVTSITYLDTAGATQTLAANQYVVDTALGRIAEAYSVTWPSTRDQINAVTIRLVAGYGATADSVPAGIREGLLLTVGNYYAHREEMAVGEGLNMVILPQSAAALWSPFIAYR